MNDRCSKRRLVTILLGPILYWASSYAAWATVGPLINTGFEELDGAMPTGWKVFVAPQPGATGEVDTEDAYDGRNCVRLHIPAPYRVEPANNFSQPVPLAQTGIRVRVRGYIKTSEATEAAIWLQCFQRDPWMVSKHVTSSATSPVSGTMGWTPVKFTTLIPKATDFAMIRCVLKGHGTAWFDDVTVTPMDNAQTGTSERINTAELEAPVEATPPETESSGPVDARPAAVPRENYHYEAQVANEKLRESNDALAAQMQELQVEITELRTVLAQPRPFVEPADRPPPLVPHGYRWENRPK